MSQSESKVSDVCAEIELNRMILKMGLVPDELQGATTERWGDLLVIYKTLFDWVRAKNYYLSAREIEEIESAIKEKISEYSSTSFGESSPNA
jgi:hypothetical protein